MLEFATAQPLCWLLMCFDLSLDQPACLGKLALLPRGPGLPSVKALQELRFQRESCVT